MKEIDMLAMARTNGFRLGNAQDRQGGTGCTVLVFPDSAPCAVDVRGGGRPAGNRNCSVLWRLRRASTPSCSAAAVPLASMPQLASCSIWKNSTSASIRASARCPLVVESCIYDLGCGDNVRPDAAMGYAACQASESGDFRQAVTVPVRGRRSASSAARTI